jgi:hypothetical protein
MIAGIGVNSKDTPDADGAELELLPAPELSEGTVPESDGVVVVDGETVVPVVDVPVVDVVPEPVVGVFKPGKAVVAELPVMVDAPTAGRVIDVPVNEDSVPAPLAPEEPERVPNPKDVGKSAA